MLQAKSEKALVQRGRKKEDWSGGEETDLQENLEAPDNNEYEGKGIHSVQKSE